MAVTTAQIRDLLNRPRGLNENTITEYITIRTAEVNKKARGALYLATDSTAIVSDTLKESAIKMMVCVDCLRVLIDTLPTFVPEKEQGTQDIRFSQQLRSFEKQALEAIRLIEEKGGSAFKVDATDTRVGGTTSAQLSGSIHPTNL
tara:strand:+ start:517 stop:954 length:438 start_codon:yes stop_codon:yes gene_type:complete